MTRPSSLVLDRKAVPPLFTCWTKRSVDQVGDRRQQQATAGNKAEHPAAGGIDADPRCARCDPQRFLQRAASFLWQAARCGIGQEGAGKVGLQRRQRRGRGKVIQYQFFSFAQNLRGFGN